MDDIQMTEDGDIRITDGDIAPTDSVKQKILIHLRWFLGEWRYKEEYGADWFGKVFVKNPNKTIILGMISHEIMSIDGVKTVNSITMDFDHKTRIAKVDFDVVLDNNERFKSEAKIWER